jgi:hypothetical protein
MRNKFQVQRLRLIWRGDVPIHHSIDDICQSGWCPWARTSVFDRVRQDTHTIMADARSVFDIQHTEFDLLGYAFQPRGAKNSQESSLLSFLPAISHKAAKAI